MKIGIAGGGLLGRLLAWHCLREGHSVSLFEAGSLTQCPGAARTAAGMLSPLSELAESEHLVYEMGKKALSFWPRWLSDLEGKVDYAESGSVILAHQQDAALLREFSERLDFHLGDARTYRWLNSKELREVEPDLAPFHEALYLPPEAHLDNRSLLDRLLAEIQRLGGNCFEHCSVTCNAVGEVVSESGRYCFDRVLDCRGVGAGQDGLRGVRGEVLWVETAEVTLQRPVRLMHPRYRLYIVPKPGNQFVIGATEIESEDLSPMSLRSNLELSSALYSINPAFAEARVIEMDVNLRPAFANNLPQIQDDGRMLSVNGLYRHGYLLAPAVVEATLSLLFDRQNEFLPHLLQQNTEKPCSLFA